MTPERWAQTKEILAQALEVPEAERSAFVRAACGTDAELREEVWSLLAASGEDEDTLASVRDAIAMAAADVLGRRSTTTDDPVSDAAVLSVLETALGQQYEIVRQLGRGGMGAVYLARERALERFVAIKVLRPDLANAADSRERFRREARIVAQLSHPNILPLHTFGEVKGIWYFVMGYVRGVTLAERLRVEGRLSSGEALRILSEIADAVDCAHRHGVVHRDIKPANVLLDEDTGRAMLADFGISKVGTSDDSLTATGVVVGTPHFMSPEQSIGSPSVDERSDIYSIGAVGYTMLAGREPFAGMSAAEVTRRRLAGDPPSLSESAPNAPPELVSVIMRCLSRQPSARWPDVLSLRNALARARDPDSASLPDGVRDLPAFGPYALMWAVLWTLLALGAVHDAGDRALLLLIALLVPLGFLLHIWNVGRQDGDTLELARVAFWPPEWWGMWWPSALRRPNDMWWRLPWPARAIRTTLSAFIVVLPTLILFRRTLERAIGPLASNEEWFVQLEAFLILAAATATAAALAWAYRHGLTRPEAVRILFGATTPTALWKTPALARLLKPVAGNRARSPLPDSAPDHRRAIGDIAGGMALSAATRQRLNGVVESIVRSIEDADAQIALLSRDANAREVDRLTAQLAALESQSGTPTVERRELIGLVQQQLDVVRRMRIRCEALSQRRAHLMSILRGAWTRLDQLRGEGESSPTSRADDRVGAIIGDAERALIS